MMKKIMIIAMLFLMCGQYSHAQINVGKIIDKSIKKAEKNVERRIEKRVDKSVDNTLDTIENGVFGKGGTKNKSTGQRQDATGVEAQKQSQTKSKDSGMKEKQISGNQQDSSKSGMQQPLIEWNTYDFVPGTTIIFEDDFSGEQNGEFPSRWDMVRGGVIENAVIDGYNVMYFKKTNATVPNAVCPLLDVRKSDYLPEQFTVEFDCYFGRSESSANNGWTTYYLFLYDSKNQSSIMSAPYLKPIRVTHNRVENDHTGDTYPGFDNNNRFSGWRHVSISFNKRALKGYLDDRRLMNIPNVEFNPTGIMLSAHNVSGNHMAFVKNIRIAKGAVPLYDKVLSEGKFVTHGILFDVNKSTIKPESMGTINYVFKMMSDNPSLNFSIEGHTDSDGDEVLNQNLSEARAQSVMNTLVSMGISSSRLASKGMGETKPMSDNSTAEGKANNRRVEFIKF